MNHSINQEEVSKFDELDWWDPNGPLQTLHHLNPIRLRFIEQHIKLKHTRVADVGCGGGLLSEAMASAGAKITGIDANPTAIACAKEHAESSGLEINYQCTSIEAYVDQQSEPFEHIVCMELLEHVDDPKAFLSYLAKLLQPGGKLLLSTINRTPYAYLGAILGAEYLLKLLPKGTHDYQKLITPAELSRAARHHGLKTTDIQGMQYNPLTGTAKLANNVDINYLICCEKESS